MAIMRRMSLFINSDKIAEAMDVQITITKNGEQQHGSEGVEAMSTGNVEVEIKTNTVRPIKIKSGQKRLLNALINDIDVDARVEVGDVHFFVPVRVMIGDYTSDSKTGALKGAWTMKNSGNPVVIGA